MDERPSVVVVMPAWNEADGIADYLDELNNSLSNRYLVSFIVIDDFSGDSTFIAAQEKTAPSVQVLRNQRNLGHGPSVVRALKAGLDLGASYIVATDGDGQFSGRDLSRMLELALGKGSDVVEGVRTFRNKLLYRRFVSLITRCLVGFRIRTPVNDANTPARVYRREALHQIIPTLPETPVVPNLFISVSSRKLDLNILEAPVTVRPPLKKQPSHSPSSLVNQLPTRDFLTLCARAGAEWMRDKRGESAIDDDL